MAKQKIRVTEWTCDNPACGVSRIDYGTGEGVEGLIMTGVIFQDSGGGGKVDVYACSVSCVGDAVKGAIGLLWE